MDKCAGFIRKFVQRLSHMPLAKRKNLLSAWISKAILDKKAINNLTNNMLSTIASGDLARAKGLLKLIDTSKKLNFINQASFYFPNKLNLQSSAVERLLQGAETFKEYTNWDNTKIRLLLGSLGQTHSIDRSYRAIKKTFTRFIYKTGVFKISK